jgi:hypothetical protein
MDILTMLARSKSEQDFLNEGGLGGEFDIFDEESSKQFTEHYICMRENFTASIQKLDIQINEKEINKKVKAFKLELKEKYEKSLHLLIVENSVTVSRDKFRLASKPSDHFEETLKVRLLQNESHKLDS